MTHQPYSYVVLRYVPDQGAGESLNVGVVLYSESSRFFDSKIDSHYERLSQAFATFDGPAYRRAVASLIHAFRGAERSLSDRPLLADDRSLIDWLRTLMPDIGGSLSFTIPRHGIAEDLAEEVAVLYERMVQSQGTGSGEHTRRDDAQVWRTYEKLLKPAISKQLRPKSFATDSVKVDFEHAIKNGAWHVIQPVSMDFQQPESMQRKASQWVGTAVGLNGAPELGTIFFLLGEPAKHRKAYERAKALLDQAPVKHEIIEERDAERLNRRLLDLIGHDTN
ncbi:MAG TPA: DUF3037 domain-containing protein [Vicinamibacterales bacterium]|nr:DUF3037 domain-containing protein [Vicinamibacterales bacterium]